jgi:subtilisin family serine protease
MKEDYLYDVMSGSSVHEKIAAYRRIAETSQSAAIAWLKTMPEDADVGDSWWVMNAFYVKATTGVILELAKRGDVRWISHNGEVRAIYETVADASAAGRAAEWGIRKIMADSCWNAGYTGQGVILGMCDTGVDYTHPALAGKWSGYWLDVINGQPTPYDDMTGTWHGTHCMGTIMGGDGNGPFADDIGVAPGATFVAAKMLNSGGSGTYAQCNTGLQFMADLKDSVDIKAVSNSWGGSNGADTFFYPVNRTYISLGIVPIFANGNSGPNAGTVGCPGAGSNVIGVGATDSTDAIANFSSRGPAPDQAPFNDPSTWLREDWNLIKPNISAPGVNIRSAKGDGSGTYHNLSGTSMATPHTCGATGLLFSKNQNLTPQMVYSILLDNVDEPSAGGPYPNNNFGWGRLNVWRSLNGTPTMNQPWISIMSKSITDPAPGGNGNGILEPGETGRMTVNIKNTGGAQAGNTVGDLKSFDNYLTIVNGSYAFGDLAPGATASNSGNPYTFSIHTLTPQGHVSRIALILRADGAQDSLDFCDTTFYSLTIGTAPGDYVIYQDDFEYGSGIDSFLNYWDRTGNWAWSTRQNHSPTHSAFSGAASDSARFLTLKNAVNLSAFPNPRLKFWHTYAFDQGIFMDSCAVLASTNGGSTWSGIWGYNWTTGNTLPWTEVTANLPSAGSVKIRFLIDGYTFFQDSTNWFIDDFRITVPADNEPPYFTNTTDWPDTTFTGPFPVQSTVTDLSGVDSARLYYRINSGSWQPLVMTLQSGNLYQAAIPSQPLGTVVDYYLWAKDRWITPNTGCDPVGAPSGSAYYSFQVRTIGVAENCPVRVRLTPGFANPVRDRARVNFGIDGESRIRILIFDLTGRRVKTLADARFKAGAYDIAWDLKDDMDRLCATGVYFLDFRCGSNDEFRQVEKLVLVK